MSIKVTNNCSYEIQVAINQWGNNGDTGVFPIIPGNSESWDRTDERGFIMIVEKVGAKSPYYVNKGSEILVANDGVKNHGVILRPIVDN